MGEEKVKELDDFNKDDLLAIAEAAGVEIKDGAKKDAVVKALKKAKVDPNEYELDGGDPEISEEAKTVAKEYTKEQLIGFATDEKVEIDKSAKEEVIAQVLLDADVKFQDDKDKDKDKDEDEETEEEKKQREINEAADNKKTEIENRDMKVSPGKFIVKGATVYFPSGEFCRTYKKDQVKDEKGKSVNPNDVAKDFAAKKNSQLNKGLWNEGKKAGGNKDVKFNLKK